jgi:hypothetical protein
MDNSDTYYCVPIIDDGQWMDLESQMGQEDLLIANPYKGMYATHVTRGH